MNGRDFAIDNYLSVLKEEIGANMTFDERIPGVYYIESIREDGFPQEYYAVLDTAPIAQKLRDHGKKIEGISLFAWDEPASGWRIISYEITKYKIIAGKPPVNEWQFRDSALHAMELHPEYFGMFPVPFHTPRGFTLLYRTLANGIYWLETSECKELLAVCFPVWNAELSPAAASLARLLAWDAAVGVEKAMGYLFFTRGSSCVPIYELMMTRQKWDGTVIDVPALMNALWKYAPKYAVHLNGGKAQVLDDELTRLLGKAGQEAIPHPDGKHMIGMLPDVGTDFLLLE